MYNKTTKIGLIHFVLKRALQILAFIVILNLTYTFVFKSDSTVILLIIIGMWFMALSMKIFLEWCVGNKKLKDNVSKNLK